MNKEQIIREILGEILEDERLASTIGLDENLLETETLDSLGIAQLVPELEDRFSLGEIDGEDILPENFETIAAMIALVTRYQEK